MKKYIVYGLGLLCLVGFPLALHLAFFEAPLQTGGQTPLYWNQKIFYFHVPSAFVTFIAVFVCGIWSMLYLRSRDPRHDTVARSAAECAIAFGLVMLITGSIWGKAAWGIWWQWEARLTMAFMLWLLMIAYVLVRTYFGAGSEVVCAGLGAFAMVSVPLIYISVNLWRGNHPKTSAVPSLTGMMKTAFWTSVLLWISFFVMVLQARIAVARGEIALQQVREYGLDSGLLE